MAIHYQKTKHPETWINKADRIGVCILAAGIAKRLEPISAIIAKPAFPLGGQIPIAEMWVNTFVDAGLNRIAMNLHRVPESIRSYFGNGETFGADISYVDEEEPSGTLGGAIKMLKALKAKGFHPERVFIPSGDIVSSMSSQHIQYMVDQHLAQGAVFSVMLAPIPWDRRADFGTVKLKGFEEKADIPPNTYALIENFIEKDPNSPSNENNASNYLVEADFLLSLEEYLTEAKLGLDKPCYDFGKHVLMGITGSVPHLSFLQQYRHRIFGYDPGQFWFDVGNKNDYLQVNKAILTDQLSLPIPYKKYAWGWLGQNVKMNISKVEITSPVIIADNCEIEDGAQIGPNVVLAEGWKVCSGAKIRNAVLWPNYNQVNPKISQERIVESNSTIDDAIIVAGQISGSISHETVDVLADGQLDKRPLDWVPAGKRA